MINTRSTTRELSETITEYLDTLEQDPTSFNKTENGTSAMEIDSNRRKDENNTVNTLEQGSSIPNTSEDNIDAMGDSSGATKADNNTLNTPNPLTQGLTTDAVKSDSDSSKTVVTDTVKITHPVKDLEPGQMSAIWSTAAPEIRRMIISHLLPGPRQIRAEITRHPTGWSYGSNFLRTPITPHPPILHEYDRDIRHAALRVLQPAPIMQRNPNAPAEPVYFNYEKDELFLSYHRCDDYYGRGIEKGISQILRSKQANPLQSNIKYLRVNWCVLQDAEFVLDQARRLQGLEILRIEHHDHYEWDDDPSGAEYTMNDDFSRLEQLIQNDLPMLMKATDTFTVEIYDFTKARI